jgi:hypothetical protein
MQTATKPQIAKIHALLNNLGILEQKADIVYNLTDGRTESSKQLTVNEARRLITNLAEYDPNERLKSLIFSLAYQAGIIYGSSPDDKKMNAAKLNLFLKERGAVKLELNQMHYKELIKTHRQFEAIVKKTKQADEIKQADKAVKHLLFELDIKIL